MLLTRASFLMTKILRSFCKLPISTTTISRLEKSDGKGTRDDDNKVLIAVKVPPSDLPKYKDYFRRKSERGQFHTQKY